MSTTTLDPVKLAEWIGRSEIVEDIIDAAPLSRMCATLDLDSNSFDSGSAVPPLWHWIYFLSSAKRSELGREGHPKLGGFLPPVALQRRMWAGGRFEFTAPLRVGDHARRVSTIKDVKVKAGKSGDLCFVTVKHGFFVKDALRFTEEHDIVYRNDPAPDAPKPEPPKPPGGGVWRQEIVPDSVLLFRYSALTFNGHRIHYDRPYCTSVEGYPDLVYHGPLTATQLVGLAVEKNPNRQLKSFEFRAVSPLFNDHSFTLNGFNDGDQSTVWAANPEGLLAVKATAIFA